MAWCYCVWAAPLVACLCSFACLQALARTTVELVDVTAISAMTTRKTGTCIEVATPEGILILRCLVRARLVVG